MKCAVVMIGVALTLGAQAATDASSLLREVVAARTRGGGTITLSDGLYVFDTPWKLGPDDRNLVFEAAPGAVPVISAGRRIAGWSVGKDGWWRVRLPKGERFSQLYVNGQRRQRPFLPRTGYYYVRDRVEDAYRKEREGAYLRPQDLPAGDNPEMEFCMFSHWKMFRAKIASCENASGRVAFDAPPLGNDFDMPNPARWYRLDNVKSALGEPGDWYWDALAGELTYVPHPGETPANCVIVAARFPHALKIENSENILFRGLVFAHGADQVGSVRCFSFVQAAASCEGTVQVESARGVRFEDCGFLHTGATGLVLCRGSHDCSAVRCEFADLGAGGVRIGDRDGDAMASGCTVGDCLIEKGGRFTPSGAGVLICHAHDNLVSGNTIHDFFYTGISLGWGWCLKQTACRNVIENNDIDCLGQRVLSDLGGIYTLSRQAGTVIRGNRVRDVTRARYGAYGIYHDSGSAEIVVSNNVVSGCMDAAWFVAAISASNRVENNLFCDSMHRQLDPMLLSGEGVAPSRFAGNVVKWSTQVFSALPDASMFESENNAYVCDEAGLPAARDVRGFVRCRDVAEAKARIGFKPFAMGNWGWRRSRRFTAKMPAVPSVFFPAPPRPVEPCREDFAHCKIGDPWPMFGNSCENRPETIRVVEDPSASAGKCIEFTQSLHAWRPHVYRSIARECGLQRISFRIKLEKGASTYLEVRDGEYHSEFPGPFVSLVGGGKLSGRGGALMDLPAGVWVRVGLEFQLGEGVTDHTYAICVKLPDDERARIFRGIPISPRFTSIGWLGFVSNAHEGQKFRVDDFRLDP